MSFLSHRFLFASGCWSFPGWGPGGKWLKQEEEAGGGGGPFITGGLQRSRLHIWILGITSAGEGGKSPNRRRTCGHTYITSITQPYAHTPAEINPHHIQLPSTIDVEEAAWRGEATCPWQAACWTRTQNHRPSSRPSHLPAG